MARPRDRAMRNPFGSLRRIPRLLWAVAVLIPAPAAAQAPPRSTAAILTESLQTTEGIRKAVAAAKGQGRGIVQVPALVWGEAWYNGGAAPRAEALAGQPESFDPLRVAIDEAHADGLKVTAAIVVLSISRPGSVSSDPAHVAAVHPDWLMVDRAGALPADGARSLDPGSPAARAWIHGVVLDIARRYSVDGIVLRDVQYPGPDLGFSDEDLAQFRAMLEPSLTREQKDALALLPERDAWTRMFPARWAQWRRDNVDGLVRRITDDVRAVKPAVTVEVTGAASAPTTARQEER